MVRLTAKKFLAAVAAIALLAFAPAMLIPAALTGLAVWAVKRGAAREREYRVTPAASQQGPPPSGLQDWQLQYIPIEQRDWVRRNINL